MVKDCKIHVFDGKILVSVVQIPICCCHKNAFFHVCWLRTQVLDSLNGPTTVDGQIVTVNSPWRKTSHPPAIVFPSETPFHRSKSTDLSQSQWFYMVLEKYPNAIQFDSMNMPFKVMKHVHLYFSLLSHENSPIVIHRWSKNSAKPGDFLRSYGIDSPLTLMIYGDLPLKKKKRCSMIIAFIRWFSITISLFHINYPIKPSNHKKKKHQCLVG